MIEIAGLWVAQGKENKIYFRGRLGNATLLLFKNERKKLGDNQPDYRLFVADSKRDASNKPRQDDDIPF